METVRSPDSSVGIATGYARGKVFHFSTTSILALGPTQPPIQWVLRVLYPGVKQPGREADH
jgi:hypothetical protein